MAAFTRLSLARQYLLVSFLVMLLAMFVIGAFVARQIEAQVIERTAAFTSLYVNSYVTHYLSSIPETGALSADDIRGLDRLIKESPLSEEIVSFKVWSPDHRVLYSSDPQLINQWYPDNPELDRSLVGEVTSDISDLSGPENELERRQWNELFEIYAPILATHDGRIIAVSEFYQLPDALRTEIRRMQRQSWLVIGISMLAAYLVLAGLVGRASQLIATQHSQLVANLLQNRRLHAQVQRAAARTTTLNEQFLSHLSADLHDGMAQDLALALLRLEPLYEGVLPQDAESTHAKQLTKDFQFVKTALDSALTEVRAIAAGLRSPKLETFTIDALVHHAVHEYERKTGCSVQVTLASLTAPALPWLPSIAVPDNAPLAIKVTLYRLLQEALNNSFRHAAGATQSVAVEKMRSKAQTMLSVKIVDQGPGFDVQQSRQKGRLGLAGMRERVEVLGGFFQVTSAPDAGTTVWACLPLTDVVEGTAEKEEDQ